MRIPLVKNYRAFPELDEFTDAQCQLLLQRIRLSRLSRVIMYVTAYTTFAVTFFLSGGLFGYLWEITIQFHLPLHIRNNSAVVAAPLLVLLLMSVLAGLLTRDFFLRRLLLKAIHVRIDKVRCPQCKYILIGQQEQEGAVTCPECGRTTLLVAMGLETADLIPPDSALAPLGRELEANPELKKPKTTLKLEFDRFKL